MDECLWKPNWQETKKHFIGWWMHDGLVLGMWGTPPAEKPRFDRSRPEFPDTVSAR